MLKRDRNPGEIRKFRGVTVIDWDSEPSSERPSEFPGASVPGGAWDTARSSRRAHRQGGFGALWLGLGVVVATAASGMFGLMLFLRG